MSKTPPQLADERGFFTLPLPKPTFFDVLNKYRTYRWLTHRLLFLRMRFAHSGHIVVLLVAGATGLIILASLTTFFMPKTLALSFGQENCLFNPQLLPELTEHQAGKTFTSTSKPLISIAGQPMVSLHTCVHASAAPVAGSTDHLSLAPLGNPLLKKQITVSTGSLPTPSASFDSSQAIGTGSSLHFTLDQSDKTFTYQLTSQNATSSCQTTSRSISCPLQPLGLKPGSTLELALVRQFNGNEVDDVLSTSITTLDPITVTNTSITEGSIIYDSPRSINVAFNKPLQPGIGGAKLTSSADGSSVTDITNEISGTSMVISFAELGRSTSYRLEISNLTAEDSSMLEAPYVLNFTTSGGPKVVGSSVGSYKILTGSNIVLTFDIGLHAGQNLASIFKVSTDNGEVTSSVTLSGNKVTINPNTDLPRCSNFKISVGSGLINQYGIGGGEAYTQNSRTICQVTFSIGTSVQGRSIIGYRFGNGSSKVVFVGGTHGNEKSSYHTLMGLIDDLERRAHEIPGNRSVIVIPNLNPDGFARSSRTNANNVDLNRNFPSYDWQTSIQMPGGVNLPNGGGINPLDQPEAIALANFIQANNPRLVLTYHAVARIIISNDSGDSITQAQKYASDSSYTFSSGANSGGTFEYATTGEFEEWLADKEGVAGILVELSSMSANQYNSHKKAMWSMIQLP